MKLVSLSEIFHLKYGNSLELNKLQKDEYGINFVSRTSNNNGVSTKVKKLDSIEPSSAFTITVALGGSVLSTFLQPEPFYSGYHIFCLIPKTSMTDREKLFYCSCIEANKYKYNYGRQANRTLKDLLVPSLNSIPKWINDIDLEKFENISKPQIENSVDLNYDDIRWKEFKIEDLFDRFEKCKCSNASKLLENGNEIAYIGAKKNNNGFMAKVNKVENLITKGNCICFICDGQGSVGYAIYQPNDFIGSTTLNVAYLNNLNPHIALFIVTILDLERFRYSFGRKNNINRMKASTIKLPTDKNGNPDWQFMEDYIKSLPYSGSI